MEEHVHVYLIYNCYSFSGAPIFINSQYSKEYTLYINCNVKIVQIILYVTKMVMWLQW